jgi:hypothetical protein
MLELLVPTCSLSSRAIPSQSQSHIATDGQSVSLGVEPSSGAHDQIFIAVW